MLRVNRTMGAVMLAALVSAGAAGQAVAQPGPGGSGWGPGMMMGPGMMGRGGFGFLCNPRMAGFAEWRLAQIEAAVKPSDAQKALLNDLKSASAKAAEIIAGGCPTGVPATSTERLELAEKRLEAMLQAIKTVRPAFQAFYDALDDKQKASLDAAGPRTWGWRHWHWRWNSE
ncbi:MAG: Spy/CpxP family protein refolding chaperone [Hyphomicrobiaceae bacterium]|nr:Spy/CpxP family protein refolding chaperone [Hyphomicrobiaceae bacterium]